MRSLKRRLSFAARLGRGRRNLLLDQPFQRETEPGDIHSNFARVIVASGTARLSGASDYAGTTHIDGGTLRAENTTGSATGTGAVAVHAGGTLAGNGSVAGSVTVEDGGTLSPGSSIGDLSVGDLTLASSAVLAIELDPVQGTHDLVRISGGVTLDLADLVLSLLSAPTRGQWLDFLLNDGTDAIVGRFAQGDLRTSWWIRRPTPCGVWLSVMRPGRFIQPGQVCRGSVG